MGNTVKYSAQTKAMKLAHTIAKTLDNNISYSKRLGKSIKMAWSKIRSKVIYELLDAYTTGKEKITEAKSKIENGGKFNGIVYSKAVNKNNSLISIYVSNVLFCFKVQKEDVLQVKEEILNFLSAKDKSNFKYNNYGYCGSNDLGFDGIEG